MARTSGDHEHAGPAALCRGAADRALTRAAHAHPDYERTGGTHDKIVFLRTRPSSPRWRGLALGGRAVPRGRTEAQIAPQLRKSLTEAQSRLDAAASDVAELSRQLYGDDEGDVVRFMQPGRRGAMLGVNIGTEKPRDSGVEIMGVSPGGPAKRRVCVPPTSSSPSTASRSSARRARRLRAQLVEHLTEVEPGERVKVDYLRGDKRQTATVTTKAAEPPFFAMFRDRLDVPGRGESAGHRVVPAIRDVSRAGAWVRRARAGRDHAATRAATSERTRGCWSCAPPTSAPTSCRKATSCCASMVGCPRRRDTRSGSCAPTSPAEKVKLDVLRNRKRMTVSVVVPPATSDERCPAVPATVPRRSSPPFAGDTRYRRPPGRGRRTRLTPSIRGFGPARLC